ncbi:Uncharacterised protein [Vibrio cholerae]|nr:Uncharacterised protein [Vibrio cholerae]CSB34503.1 Uncharacterised protein [Vibrio cholerae]CSC90848.1 Uncharacterised protein [Vibrio cholerae]CSD12321.1 Uncharacterised protein [Vibrio cholerae]CSI59101.1 Uncharacterised protein [Vibrio cholerae]
MLASISFSPSTTETVALRTSAITIPSNAARLLSFTQLIKRVTSSSNMNSLPAPICANTIGNSLRLSSLAAPCAPNFAITFCLSGVSSSISFHITLYLLRYRISMN